MGYFNMKSFFKAFCAVSFAGILSACSTMNNDEAAPEKYSDLHFDNKKPIELMVKKIEVKSEFSPSFTRPNVEHLFPISIEKTAKTWQMSVWKLLIILLTAWLNLLLKMPA